MLRYNSTFKVVNKPCKCGCGRSGQIFSKGMLKQCWTRWNGKPLKKFSDKRIKAEEQDESWKNLRDELDTVFSLVIRLKEADREGYNQCYTCDRPVRVPYKQLECGHAGARVDMANRYYEDACKPQCSFCNQKHETNPEIFRNKLEKEHAGIIEQIDENARSVAKLTTSDLKSLLWEYRAKFKLLMLKLK